MIVSVDPGISGCAVAMTEQGEYVGHIIMPTIKPGKRNRVNAYALGAWFSSWQGIKLCVIERVSSMPQQGVASVFSFGHSAGVIDGLAGALQIPCFHPTPQSWKKHHGLIGKDKEAARALALSKWPHVADLSLKGKGQAVADAILMGEYAIAKAKGE